MTLRRRTQLYLGITMLILLLLLDLTFTGLLRHAAEKADRERLMTALSQTSSAITAEADALSDIANNWAFSDDTCNYIKNRERSFVTQILNKEVITDIGISSVILVNDKREVILFKDFSPTEMPSTPQSEFQAIFSNKENVDAILNPNKNKNGVRGVALKDGDPILFSAKPVLPSNKHGKPFGFLIATKAINVQLIHEISENLGFKFKIVPTTENEKNNKSIAVKVVNHTKPKDAYISGSILIKDHLGKPAFWLYGASQKEDTYATEKKMQKFFLFLAVSALLISMLFDVIMNQIIFKRVSRLRTEIEGMRDETTSKGSVTVDTSRDEITWLQQTFNDLIAYREYIKDKKDTKTRTDLDKYKNEAEMNKHTCIKTLEDMAVALSPGDGYFRTSILRSAKMTQKFCLYLEMSEDEAFNAYLGALFSRIGQIGLPFSMRNRTTSYTPQEQALFLKYPLTSKDIVKSMEATKNAYEIPLSWNENWNGSGFPSGIANSSIPLTARVYAIVDMWNELTRSWPGRRMLSDMEVESRLREMMGSRFDPSLIEKFITMLKDEKEKKIIV
ncbi:MAG: CHASE4 domain-containing protein [Synergistaceae bacterium]